MSTVSALRGLPRTAVLAFGRLLFPRITPTEREVSEGLPGDDLIGEPDVVMDRGFDVPAAPEAVWPWFVQLGKQRAGWYFPRAIERFIPPGRRGTRVLHPAWQQLSPGDVIPDYGGRHETFTVASIDPPRTSLYRSRRRQMDVTWEMSLTAIGDERTRVHLRLRLGPVRRRGLVDTGGELIDAVTIAGLAAGLVERVTAAPR